MVEMPKQQTMSSEDEQQKSGSSQYQHQTLTLHNTIGLMFMSIMAFALLAALLRQQRRNRELILQLAKQQKSGD
jgi:hypothetical protein